MVVEALRQILLPGSVDAHLAATCAIGQDDSVLRLRVANVFQKHWVENRLARVTGYLCGGGYRVATVKVRLRQRTIPVTIFGTNELVRQQRVIV